MKLIIIFLSIIGSNSFSSSSFNSKSYPRPINKGFYYSNSKIMPNIQIDQEFQSEIVSANIMVKWRYSDFDFYGIQFEHPDIIFTLLNQKEHLVIGFHKEAADGHRYEATRITAVNFQNLNLYHRTDHANIKNPKSILKILQTADYLSQEEYSIFFNNCKDSAVKLIERLIFF